MSELMWIRSHVELLLRREWAPDEVTLDGDGDFTFRRGTAVCWVSVVEYDIPMVRVFAHAAYGVKPTAKVLRELNEIQKRCVSASVSVGNDTVLVSQTLSPINLTQPVLAQAMNAVANVADDIGGLLAAVYGGQTPFDALIQADAG